MKGNHIWRGVTATLRLTERRLHRSRPPSRLTPGIKPEASRELFDIESLTRGLSPRSAGPVGPDRDPRMSENLVGHPDRRSRHPATYGIVVAPPPGKPKMSADMGGLRRPGRNPTNACPQMPTTHARPGVPVPDFEVANADRRKVDGHAESAMVFAQKGAHQRAGPASRSRTTGAGRRQKALCETDDGLGVGARVENVWTNREIDGPEWPATNDPARRFSCATRRETGAMLACFGARTTSHPATSARAS